jgi:ribosomal protein S18 acetylase RimI-like enzyme
VSDPSPATGLVVRRARSADLARTAAVHLRCLPRGFFARLGQRFLARYHASFLSGHRATALVAEVDGEVAGFLVGTTDNARHYRELLRRPPAGLVLSAVTALVRDPRVGAVFLRTRATRYLRAILRRLAPASGATSVPAGDRVAVLTHVAVDDDARGLGAGGALVDRFLDEVRSVGTAEVRLVTEAGGAATRFYRRLGWVSRGERRASDGTVVEEFARRP